MPSCFTTEPYRFESRSLCVYENHCKKQGEKGKCYYEHPCSEMYPNIIAPSGREYVLKEDLLVEYRDGCILLRKNVKLKGKRITFHSVKPVVMEGQVIKRGDTIAYTLSNKGSMRRIRADEDGAVVLVYSSPITKPEDYIIFFAEKKDVVWLDKK